MFLSESFPQERLFVLTFGDSQHQCDLSQEVSVPRHSISHKIYIFLWVSPIPSITFSVFWKIKKETSQRYEILPRWITIMNILMIELYSEEKFYGNFGKLEKRSRNVAVWSGIKFCSEQTLKTCAGVTFASVSQDKCLFLSSVYIIQSIS